MVCLKIPRRHLIYSFVAFFALFFTLFFASSSTYATSVDCNLSYTMSGGFENFPSDCDLTGLSTPVYYKGTFSLSSDSVISSNTRNFYYFIPRYSNVYYTQNNLTFSYIKSSNISDTPNFSSSVSGTLSFVPGRLTVYSDNSFTFNVSFVGTFSDEPIPSDDDCDCPEVPDCPPVPENPYDNKLDEIKNAIIMVGGVMLVIYFLFCLYQILVRHGGGR